MKYALLLALPLLAAIPARAHDTWVQPNTNVVRTGDTIYLDLLLGNHGNDHRDFKIAGKVDAGEVQLDLYGPGGAKSSLKGALQDTGYTEKDGFWTAAITPSKPGLYMVAGTSDKVVSYAPKRSIKSFKSYFIVTRDANRITPNLPGFNRKLGRGLEIVPEVNPVAPLGPGSKLAVRLYWNGKPLPDATVSFIPRGAQLKEGFDPRYERRTNVNGRASLELKAGNYYLVAAHLERPDEKGQGYDETKYSATLCLFVPQVCPCCGE